MSQVAVENEKKLDESANRAQALARWCVFYRESLFKYAVKHYKDRDIAHDIVQETFLSALRAYDSHTEYKNVRSWLFKILKNKITDFRRKKKAVLACDHKGSDNEDTWTDEHAYTEFMQGDVRFNPEALVQQRRFYEKLHTCLESLPERSREALKMRVFEGKSSKEVCSALDLSQSNLWVVIHRSKKDLREELKRLDCKGL